MLRASLFTLILAILLFACFLPAQLRPPHEGPEREPGIEAKLPNGRSQREEILKADHAKSLEDAAELVKYAEELKVELERNDRYVVSVTSLKKLDNIEKLTKRIRGRLKRY
jgi:hypothetical protein